MTETLWWVVAVLVLIAGYWGWSSWRESMHRRQAQRMFVHTRDDGVLEPEPLDREISAADPAEQARLDTFQQDEAAALAVEQDPATLELPLFEPEIPPHVGLPEPSPIEAVAALIFEQPGKISLSLMVDRLTEAGCGLRVQGLSIDGLLGPLEPNQSYQRVDLYLRLASRRGAVAGDCVARFLDELQVFARGHALGLICPTQDEILAQAQDLDAFCAQVDVLASLSVVAPKGFPFRSGAIHRLASDAGMKWNTTGTYVMLDESGSPLFSLANLEPQPLLPAGAEVSTHGITLGMEVPRVADGLTVFARMAGVARMLADRLSGQLVDADGLEMTSERLQRDISNLQSVYERMAARGISAGSEAALRVFV